MERTIIYVIILVALSFSMNAQQVIENFEVSQLSQYHNGEFPDDSLAIIDNPSPDFTNHSSKVLKFVRSKDGEISAGFSATLPKGLKLNAASYAISAQILTPRLSVIKLALEDSLGNDYYQHSAENTTTGEWETLQFSISFDGTASKIHLMLDYSDTILAEDITIYVDNIVIWGIYGPFNDSVFLNQIVVEDFEYTALNQLANGALTNDSLVVVPNPDPDNVNSSANVLRFRRSSAGDPWAGFWSALPKSIDLTESKYVYVKVWKPRISEVKFKVEGGTTTPATFELPSLTPQTQTEEWEELVFHFPDATGSYPIIALLPDYSDPVGLTEDIVLYVDDITISPTNPIEPTVVHNQPKLEYSVYPSPVKSVLYFENLDGAETLAIFNTAGQLAIVRNVFNLSTARIDVSSLSRGVYMISVYDKDGNPTVKKFVKE